MPVAKVAFCTFAASAHASASLFRSLPKMSPYHAGFDFVPLTKEKYCLLRAKIQKVLKLSSKRFHLLIYIRQELPFWTPSSFFRVYCEFYFAPNNLFAYLCSVFIIKTHANYNKTNNSAVAVTHAMQHEGATEAVATRTIRSISKSAFLATRRWYPLLLAGRNGLADARTIEPRGDGLLSG